MKEYLQNITLTQLRNLKKLKQIDVRNKLGLSDRAFRQKENCETEFTVEQFRKLAGIYGLTVEELLIVLDNTKRFNDFKL